MTLQELSDALGVPPRQIRFMIAEGCLPPAKATGRAADAYDEGHLAKGRRYITLHRLGMKPAAIKVLMAFDEALPIFQGLGLELRLDPSVDPQTIDFDTAIAALSEALRAHLVKE
jgi:DNA-binding transcriptional MerR regulator